MARIGQTLFRFTGAAFLAVGATALDHPGIRPDFTRLREEPDRPVVVATAPIPRGARISRGALRIEQWPARLVPPGAYSSIDSVVGRMADATTFTGEALIPERLASQGRETRITPGKRAYAIRVVDVSDIVHLLQPNSRVDVLVTLPPTPERPRAIAMIFMTNMRVLAIGKAPSADPNDPRKGAFVATLEVTPAEAERLAIAAGQGALSLSLRGSGARKEGVRVDTSVQVGIAVSTTIGPARR